MNGGNLFSVTTLNSGDVILPDNAPNLYSFAGKFGQQQQSYNRNQCSISPRLFFGAYTIGETSIIKTATHSYEFKTTKVQRGQKVGENLCGDLVYDIEVKQDGIIIDSILKSDTIYERCTDIKSRNIKRDYNELSVLFAGAQRGERTECENTHAIGHEYLLNYPTDTVDFDFEVVEIREGEMTINMDVDLKYHNMLAEVEIILETVLGTESSISKQEVSLVQGANKVEFIIPITETTTKINLIPKVTLYGDNSRLFNMNGVQIWKKEPIEISNKYEQDIIVVGQARYNNYLIGEFKGNTKEIVIIEDVIVNQTTQEPIDTLPTQDELPEEPSTSQPTKDFSGIIPIVLGVLAGIGIIFFIRKKK